jgi:hypothetical protein
LTEYKKAATNDTASGENNAGLSMRKLQDGSTHPTVLPTFAPVPDNGVENVRLVCDERVWALLSHPRRSARRHSTGIR